MKHRNLLLATALAGGMISAPALAQTSDAEEGMKPQVGDAEMSTGSTTEATGAQDAGNQQQDSVEVVALADWAYEPLYADGWSVEELIDEAEAYGAEGEEIGDIENVLIGENGNLLAVVLEMGGFLDLGDTHIMVPWEEVEVAPGLERITVPVEQENAEEYSMYGGVSFVTKQEIDDKQVVFEEVATGPRVWQATELLNDFAVLDGNIGYGYVDDLIFGRSGDLEAVVVTADSLYGPGAYAYPFYGFGYGFHPGLPYYELRYGEADVAQLDEFDSEQLED